MKCLRGTRLAEARLRRSRFLPRVRGYLLAGKRPSSSRYSTSGTTAASAGASLGPGFAFRWLSDPKARPSGPRVTCVAAL